MIDFKKTLLDKYKQVKVPSKKRILFIIIIILVISLIIFTSFLFLYFFVRRAIYYRVDSPTNVILPLNLINMILLCIIAGLASIYGEFIIIVVIPKFRDKEIIYPRSYSSQKKYLITNLISVLIFIVLLIVLCYVFRVNIYFMIFHYINYLGDLTMATVTIFTLFVISPFTIFFTVNILKVCLFNKDVLFIGELELICSNLEKLGIANVNNISFEFPQEQLNKKGFREEIDGLISSLGLLVKKRINSKLITNMKLIEFEKFLFSIYKNDSLFTKDLIDALQNLLKGKIIDFYISYHEFIRNIRQTKDTETYYTFSLRKIQIFNFDKFKAVVKEQLIEICKEISIPVLATIAVIIIGSLNL